MVVKLHKSQLDYFRAKARNTPNEILAYLIGSATRKEVIVDCFLYPVLTLSTPMALEIDADSTGIIRELAAAQGLHVVGDIHSHPNDAPVMSATDYSDHKINGNRISGIVEVTNRRTRVVFWQDGSPLPCTHEYL